MRTCCSLISWEIFDVHSNTKYLVAKCFQTSVKWPFTFFVNLVQFSFTLPKSELSSVQSSLFQKRNWVQFTNWKMNFSVHFTVHLKTILKEVCQNLPLFTNQRCFTGQFFFANYWFLGEIIKNNDKKMQWNIKYAEKSWFLWLENELKFELKFPFKFTKKVN